MDFQLHNSFTFWVSRLANVMQERFNHELQVLDVTWPQWMVMNVLAHDLAQTPAQVAAHIGVDRSAVTRLVDRLEKKGMVERHHDGLDRRSIKVVLTDAGKRLVRHLDEAAHNHQQSFLKDLPSTEYRVLKANLQKMLRAGGVETLELWKHV